MWLCWSEPQNFACCRIYTFAPSQTIPYKSCLITSNIKKNLANKTSWILHTYWWSLQNKCSVLWCGKWGHLSALTLLFLSLFCLKEIWMWKGLGTPDSMVWNCFQHWRLRGHFSVKKWGTQPQYQPSKKCWSKKLYPKSCWGGQGWSCSPETCEASVLNIYCFIPAAWPRLSDKEKQ